MEEEQKLCLAEVKLEPLEEELLKVQMQLLEGMQVLEALAAEAEVGAMAEMVIIIQVLLWVLVINQQQMQVAVGREVMGAAVVREALEGLLLIALQEQEVQEVLVVLEEEVGAAEMLVLLQVLMEEKIMVVMVQQEAMAEVEGAAVLLGMAVIP